MVELTQMSPCAGMLPLRIGGVTAQEMAVGQMTSLAPLGAASALAGALKAAHGMDLPVPNGTTSANEARCVWFGRDAYLLMGPAPDAGLAGVAAVVDQSDAWAVVTLRGAGATDVLARLVPLDLRDGACPPGQTRRTMVKHMNASVTKLEAEAFLILVYRSMAGTLVHDLKAAMAAVAARG